MNRQERIEENLPLAMGLAHKHWKKWRRLSLDFGDFLAWASIGLIHAVDNYDENGGANFGTYAYTCINFKICSGIEEFRGIKRGNANTAKGSRAFQKKIRRFNDWSVPSCDDHGQKKVDDHDELAQAMRVLCDRDRECLRLLFIEGKSYVEVGKQLSISRQRVIQLRDRALRRMREALNRTSGDRLDSNQS